MDKVDCFREAEIQSVYAYGVWEWMDTIRKVQLMKSHWDLIDHHKKAIAKAQVGRHQATFGVIQPWFLKTWLNHALKANGD